MKAADITGLGPACSGGNTVDPNPSVQNTLIVPQLRTFWSRIHKTVLNPARRKTKKETSQLKLPSSTRFGSDEPVD